MKAICKTVYGLYYPETRAIVDALWSERPHAWYEQNYTGKQDAMHRPFFETWRAWARGGGVTLGDEFAFEYPTAGANEAIHALLALQATRRKRVHVFRGEYEGYSILASALGIEVVVHERDGYRDSLARAAPGDQLWVSQPSAIDGNVWSDLGALTDWLPAVAPDVEIVIDVTYVGAVARDFAIDLRARNITAVLFSLSKPFGVYYHRIGGVLSRTEIPTLRGHLWFKNLFSLHLGTRLLERHAARALPSKYASHQREALARAIEAHEAPNGTVASDVVMLAHAEDDGAFAEYRRGPGLRFCLSPAMDRIINP
jgi:histidinol-phosphate/aromatic aminotransferase/cobyric acid decarboxylase-like protein